MSESAVSCPACGAAASVAPGGAGPCPKCGFLVSARPRARAETVADDAPRRSLRLWGLIPVLVLIPAGGAALFAYQRHVEAERAERRALLEAELAAEQRVWEEQQAARRRAEITALPAALPGLMPGVIDQPADAERLGDELRKKVVGVWRGTGHAGGTREVEYHADGTFRDRMTGAGAREWSGLWAVDGATGTRVLRITREGGGPTTVRLSFEGDELIHDDEPGRATVLRRQ
ncbi:hypothetical protein J0H58_01595 [bacterium]|nr:hypothetical protein [bacterium]